MTRYLRRKYLEELAEAVVGKPVLLTIEDFAETVDPDPFQRAIYGTSDDKTFVTLGQCSQFVEGMFCISLSRRLLGDMKAQLHRLFWHEVGHAVLGHCEVGGARFTSRERDENGRFVDSPNFDNYQNLDRPKQQAVGGGATVAELRAELAELKTWFDERAQLARRHEAEADAFAAEMVAAYDAQLARRGQTFFDVAFMELED